MKPEELLRILVENLERLGLKHLVVGSTASSTFGESRFTQDIDVVVDLPAGRVTDFCAAFPQEQFYVSAAAVAATVRARPQFNILHSKSGLKIDVFVASDSAFDRCQLQRSRQVQAFPDRIVTFASPEDVVRKKMDYFREGGSDKHLRDIAGVLKVQGDRFDRDYVRNWAEQLDLSDIWQAILAQTK